MDVFIKNDNFRSFFLQKFNPVVKLGFAAKRKNRFAKMQIFSHFFAFRSL